MLKDVTVAPRAEAFLADVRQLATVVRYVDALLDPGGTTRFADLSVVERFFGWAGRNPTRKGVFQLLSCARLPGC